MPTANQIDEACRKGFFVYFGNRQQIAGASTHFSDAPADPGKVWVSRAGRIRGWEQVLQSEVVITDEPYTNDESEDHPMHGKRGPRPGQRTSSRKGRGDQANNGNREFEGMETDQRKVKAIEDAEEARQAASARLSVAHKDLEEAEQTVISAMHANGFDPDKNPVYTRAPWGSVTLQKTGEVKEKIKFTAIKKKAKKKKGSDADEGSDGDNEETE